MSTIPPSPEADTAPWPQFERTVLQAAYLCLQSRRDELTALWSAEDLTPALEDERQRAEAGMHILDTFLTGATR